MTRPAVRVRGAEPSDVEAIAEIYAGPEAIAGTLQIPYRSVEHRRERFTQIQPGSHSLVAEIDGRVVGSAMLQAEARPRRRFCGYIGMGVHDDFQNLGVGSALMEAMMDLADNWLGLHRVELTVYADNAGAVHLYQKFGFEIEGTARDFAFRRGRYVDAHFMARIRPDSAADSESHHGR
ncbi:MAG TPA: GNAT family N-acetyltransferase [Chloroflexota bacterium]|nr:GNAT family N-acetyltransferase [Chloroflexota bacterium]